MTKYHYTYRYNDWQTPHDGVNDLLQAWLDKGWKLHSMSSSIAIGSSPGPYRDVLATTPTGVLHSFIFEKEVDLPR